MEVKTALANLDLSISLIALFIRRIAALQGPAKLIHPSFTDDGNGSYSVVCNANASKYLPAGNGKPNATPIRSTYCPPCKSLEPPTM